MSGGSRHNPSSANSLPLEFDSHLYKSPPFATVFIESIINSQWIDSVILIFILIFIFTFIRFLYRKINGG